MVIRTGTGTARLPLKSLSALTVAAFITVLTESLPAGVLPLMSAGLGVGEPVAGQLVTVYAVGTAVSAIPLSLATAGWGRKVVLLAGVGGFAVANTVTALSSSFPLTLVARFVAGVAAGLVWALLVGYARRLAPERLRGKAIAVVMAGIPLALSLGIPAGTFLGGLLGWRVTFGVMTAIAVVLVAWIAAVVPDFAGRRAGRLSLWHAVTVPGVAPVLVVTVVFVLAQTVLYTYVAPVVAHVGVGSVDVVLLVFGVASLVGIWVVGAGIDRRLRELTIAGAVLVAVAVLVLATGGSTAVLVAAALWGLGWGGVPTLLQAAVGESDTAQAALVTLWNAATAAGGVVGGVLLDGAGAGALPWAVLALLVPVLVVVVAARTHGFPKSG